MTSYSDVLAAAAEYGDPHSYDDSTPQVRTQMNAALLRGCLPMCFSKMVRAAVELPEGDQFDRMRAAHQVVMAEQDRMLRWG